jgi:hypothetical protein
MFWFTYKCIIEHGIDKYGQEQVRVHDPNHHLQLPVRGFFVDNFYNKVLGERWGMGTAWDSKCTFPSNRPEMCTLCWDLLLDGIAAQMRLCFRG